MNSDMTWSQFCFLIICAVVAFVIGFSGGVSVAEKTIRREAIEAGVARYGVDAKTGKTKFVFIKP